MIKKWCWVATETKNGWRLKLAYGNKDYNLKGLVLKTDEVNAITLNKIGKTVFVHLKNTKFKD